MIRRKPCKIRPDYHDKRLINPFFQQRRAGKSPAWKKWVWRLAFIFLLFLIWLILASPWLRIKQVEVSGLTRLPETEVQNIVWEQTQARHWLVFRETNVFLFQKQEAEMRISAAYNFASVEVAKKLFGSIAVKIGERPYDFIFQQGSDYRYASSDGHVINEAAVSEEDKGRYLLLENKNPQIANMIGDKGRLEISPELLDFIMELGEMISAKPEIKPERFIIDQEANTVKVKLLEGPTVLFNSKASPASQLDYLLAIKQERLGDNFSRINYIDLRYGEKIFIN